jgi:hypothetical protein
MAVLAYLAAQHLGHGVATRELHFSMGISLSVVFLEGIIDTLRIHVSHVVKAIGKYNGVLHGVHGPCVDQYVLVISEKTTSACNCQVYRHNNVLF